MMLNARKVEAAKGKEKRRAISFLMEVAYILFPYHQPQCSKGEGLKS